MPHIYEEEEEYTRTDTRIAPYKKKSPAHNALTLVVGLAGFLLLILAAIGVWLVRQWLFIIGYLALAGAAILVLCAIALPVIFVLRYLMHADYYALNANGGVLRTLFGKTIHLRPMTAAAPAKSAEKTKVTEIAPPVPSLLDLIAEGEIAQGALEMIAGYDLAALRKGQLEIVKIEWPGTHAVAGKGRSGKTRRVVSEVCQARIGGALITICDPHFHKRDSLTNTLADIEPWLFRMARGEAEIVEAAREFYQEMEARISGSSHEELGDGNFIPRVIFFDEWSRLMTTEKLEDDDRELLIDVVTKSSTEYAGVQGYSVIIGQMWTQEATGGTAIRRSLFTAFVHNMSAEYAAFFFRPKKWQNRAEELKSRECLYKDYSGQIREIISLTVPDDTSVRISQYLASIEAPAQRQALPPANATWQAPGSGDHGQQERPTTWPGSENGQRTTGPLHLAIPSPRSPERENSFFELENIQAIDSESGERVNAATWPGEETVNSHRESVTPPETPREPRERLTVAGQGFEMHMQDELPDVPKYTPQEREAIILAALELAREGAYTRNAIMLKLGWNKKKWPIIKAVCDDNHICM